MIKCKATAQRTGGRCNNEAIYDEDGDGEPDACGQPKHRAQVKKAATLARTLLKGAFPEPRNGDANGAGSLDSLPPAEADIAADLLESAPVLPTAEAVDAATASILDAEVPEDPIAADAMQSAARAEVQQLVQSKRFSKENVRFFLSVFVEPVFTANDKDPFTPEELDEGSELGALVLQKWFGIDELISPEAALLWWAAMVVGSRYADELVKAVKAAVTPILTRIMESIRGKPLNQGIAR